MNDNNTLAVVLAGGQSKRFGEDKNQAKLGYITLLEHVLAKVIKHKNFKLNHYSSRLYSRKSWTISWCTDFNEMD